MQLQKGELQKEQLDEGSRLWGRIKIIFTVLRIASIFKKRNEIRD